MGRAVLIEELAALAWLLRWMMLKPPATLPPSYQTKLQTFIYSEENHV